MSKIHPSQQMSGALVVSVDRMTRLKHVVEGKISPMQLPDLVEYLVSDRGEIEYRFLGNTLKDQSGTQKQQVKCIILGWFEIADAVTLQPTKFTLNIASDLVLVANEEQLPPLEAESDNEDYIVCGAEFDVLVRLQEEILLILPASTPRGVMQAGNSKSSTKSQPRLPKAMQQSAGSSDTGEQKQSPFAKLAALKKSG